MNIVTEGEPRAKRETTASEVVGTLHRQQANGAATVKLAAGKLSMREMIEQARDGLVS